MRYIDEPTVASVLRMSDLIPAMRRAMIDFSHGRVAQPTRRMLAVPQHGGFFGSMPAASAAALGAKLVSFYPANPAQGLHSHMAIVALFDPATGAPLALMDGRLITEMRTAAVTAAYVDAVAAAGVKRLAVLGASTQGKSHVEALRHVRGFEDIRIWNRTARRAHELADTLGATAVASCEQAVRDADVVVCTTSSAEPLFDGRWLRPGAKVASVGWSGADGSELDAITMSNVVVVDSREGALAESGNVRRHNARIHAELGEVLDGSKPVDPQATVVFDSIGMACQDIAAGTLVLEKLAR
jgi:thiomorpholine-carboxylate dehydrogenase